MGSSIDKLVDSLHASLEEKDKRKPKPYDTTAEVTKVDEEEGIAWVHFPNGVSETPVRMTTNARVGDNVIVRVSGRRGWLLGNSTNPPTDDFVANIAHDRANKAYEKSDDALRDAERAKEAADQAEAEAGRAHTAAGNAQESADDAKASAIAANIASNSALTQLSVVEDVASVLTWISEHGTYKATTDTTVVSGKLYFTRTGEDPDYEYNLITEPSGNPQQQNYYELDTLGDESVANYISSHLALTNAGLWVLKDNSSYKVLLSNTGMSIYDNLGNLVVTYGSNIEFGGSRHFHIGSQNAYLIFDPQNGGSITLGGHNITFGTDKTLDEVLAELDGTVIFDTTYTVDEQNGQKIAHFTAHVYRGGVDIAQTNYTAGEFSWALKRELTAEEAVLYPEGFIPLGTGYTKDVDITTCGYGAEVIAKFTPANDSEVLDNNGNNLTNANNEPLTVRSTGDSVRVRDLTVSTTIYPTDKLMMVGSEDEHLVTMQTLQDYLNVNLNKQVLFNTTAAWDAQVQLQSQADTLYIYTDHQVDSEGNVIAGIKVGDGNAYLIDMPFTDSAIMEHISDNVRHISAEERAFWNNKVRCYLADNDRIIFTTA